MKDDYNWGYRNGAKVAQELGMGGKVQVRGYARGGAVKSDAAQDQKMMARHNRLMHPGQESKMMCGGKVKKGK